MHYFDIEQDADVHIIVFIQHIHSLMKKSYGFAPKDITNLTNGITTANTYVPKINRKEENILTDHITAVTCEA